MRKRKTIKAKKKNLRTRTATANPTTRRIRRIPTESSRRMINRRRTRKKAKEKTPIPMPLRKNPKAAKVRQAMKSHRRIRAKISLSSPMLRRMANSKPILIRHNSHRASPVRRKRRKRR